MLCEPRENLLEVTCYLAQALQLIPRTFFWGYSHIPDPRVGSRDVMFVRRDLEKEEDLRMARVIPGRFTAQMDETFVVRRRSSILPFPR